MGFRHTTAMLMEACVRKIQNAHPLGIIAQQVSMMLPSNISNMCYLFMHLLMWVSILPMQR